MILSKALRGLVLLELADTLRKSNQLKEAVALYGEIAEQKLLPGREDEVMQWHITALTLMGQHRQAKALTTRFEEKYPKNEATALSVAWLYVWLGDNEKALVWLEKAFAAKDFDIPAFTRDEETKSLREDPRYKAMLKRLGLPE